MTLFVLAEPRAHAVRSGVGKYMESRNQGITVKNLNAFATFSTHTPSQKKGFLVSAAIAAAIVTAVSITVGVMDVNDVTAGMVTLVALGLATGFTARKAMIAAWGYATTSSFTFTGARKFGIAWRAIGALCAGYRVMTWMMRMAESDMGLTVAAVLGICLTVGFGLLLGQQYGYNQAKAEAGSNIAVDNQTLSQATANAPVDTQVTNQVVPSVAGSTQASSQVAANIPINTLASSQAAAIAAVRDGNTKPPGNIPKATRGLWVAAGLVVVLSLGLLGYNFAKQLGPKDPAAAAQEPAMSSGMHDALYGDSTVQAATAPPAPVAAPAPPPAPVAAPEVPAAGPSPTFVAESNGGEWNSSYTQGVQEYIYRQKDGFELVIDCGSDNPGISTSLTINGQQIGSQGISGSNDAFGMIIGDHTYTNPFDTSSEVNGGANFAYFWDHLRVAKSVVLVVDNAQYNIPTEGLDKLMPVSSDQTLQCKPEI
jgi:hypothetical protein